MKQVLFAFLFMQCFTIDAQKLMSFEIEQCREPVVYFQIIHNRIISQRLRGDTLSFKLGLIHNCAFAPKNTIFTFRNDSLLLKTNGLSQTYASCECYFTMDITLTGMNDTLQTIIVDSKILTRDRSKYINFPKNEIIAKKLFRNKTDKYGRKIGYWVYRKEYGVYSVANYGNGNTYKNHFLWKKTYLNKSNELMSVALYCPEDTLISFNRPEYEKILREIELENP